MQLERDERNCYDYSAKLYSEVAFSMTSSSSLLKLPCPKRENTMANLIFSLDLNSMHNNDNRELISIIRE